MRPSLDDLRERFPHLGFAVYAFEPGGPVTLEIHAPGGHVFPVIRPTLAAAIATAFPEVDVPDPAPPGPAPAPAPTTDLIFG